jgi:hypothetical protein
LPDQYPTGEGLLDAMSAQVLPIPTPYPTTMPNIKTSVSIEGR